MSDAVIVVAVLGAVGTVSSAVLAYLTIGLMRLNYAAERAAERHATAVREETLLADARTRESQLMAAVIARTPAEYQAMTPRPPRPELEPDPDADRYEPIR